ncbi:RNA polymerase II transcription elongation factor [Zea mays]|uniref:RNA polymerase II transcription elongation factor n=1 Tax=Zea mays TaxID=4577 RepID=A0A1D6L040_MAIZE|nr:RNA polymerase II transcription elongation factor [Zea mays]
MASGSSNGEPSTAPQANRWYDLRLGSSCRDPSPTAKFCTLRWSAINGFYVTFDVTDEFKPASIDKTQAGSLQSTKDNRVTVEFYNNQPGKPKVTFEGSQEEYKDNDGVLFFDGETFRLERLHRAVKRLRHVRVPGESAAVNLAATTTGMGAESQSPPLPKVNKSQSMNKPAVHSVPVEVERIDIGEPENPGPKYNNRSTYQSVTVDPFALSPDPNEQENLDILGDDDGNASPNNLAAGQEASVRGFDINLPNQDDMDDEIADVDVNDDTDLWINAADALRAQVNAEEHQEQQDSSSSSGSSSSSSGSESGSGSGSSSSGSDGSDADSASSGGDVDI